MKDLIEKLEAIIGTLRPVQDQDWHGKWRVQAAIKLAEEEITILRQHEAEPTTIVHHDAKDGANCPSVFSKGDASTRKDEGAQAGGDFPALAALPASPVNTSESSVKESDFVPNHVCGLHLPEGHGLILGTKNGKPHNTVTCQFLSDEGAGSNSPVSNPRDCPQCGLSARGGPHVCQGEISVVDKPDALIMACEEILRIGDKLRRQHFHSSVYNKAERILRSEMQNYLRTMKPVMVSLSKCLEAVDSLGRSWDDRSAAKAVLNSAKEQGARFDYAD